MQDVQTWDAIIVGGGIIGLSLSIELRKRGLKVLIVERGEPGQEASHAAAGMLADRGGELPPLLQALATASARMYPEFVHELGDESGVKVDLRDQGTILLHEPAVDFGDLAKSIAKLEPALEPGTLSPSFLDERSVDPRQLAAAALKAAKHRGVDIASGSLVTGICASGGHVGGVKTDKTTYSAPAVVNCAGAWAGQFSPCPLPTRPIKGQILSVIGGPTLAHVVRAPEVYLVPRTDGRIVIGATAEDVGYDKRTEPEVIQKLLRTATMLVPALSKSRIHEAWAGLRPGSPDGLPILGETSIRGYFAATGHFRDGILLAPVTAAVMAGLIAENNAGFDLSAFSPERFAG
jgi:glycine oxidase